MIDPMKLRDTFRRICVQGTSEHPEGYGPPYGPPWFVIDAATAEPEVNWPGELLCKCDSFEVADQQRWAIIATEVCDNALKSG